MPRLPRNIEPGHIYHLISRFVDREWFIESESEREHYRRMLGRALNESDWRLLGYAIMSNHVHLAMVAGTQPLAGWIRRVHSPFADSMNRSYQRIGPMFVRGPKAYVLAPGALPDLLAYIHNNPVRAGVCATADATTWTSHRAYLGIAPTPPWLHVTEGLERTGFADRSDFNTWVNDPLRRETEDHFTAEHYELVATTAATRPLALPDATADAIAAAAANLVGIPLDRLRSPTRGRSERLAREVAVHAAGSLGVSGRAVAKALCLSQQRVSVLRREGARGEVQRLSDEVTKSVERAETSGSSSA